MHDMASFTFLVHLMYNNMLMAMKKERDAGVDDDGSVAVESTAFTLSRQFLT